MRALPIALLVAVAFALPLSTACYAPRIESCRGAVEDSSSVEEVRLIDVNNPLAFEIATGQVGYRVEAPGLEGSCISVHSELLRDGAVIHTLDTTLVVRDVDGVPTSSRLHHYRSGDMVRVTTLGRTIEARVADSFEFRDAGVVDGGFRPDALLPSDTPIPFDAGLDDAGIDDAGLDDAGIEDGGIDDAGPESDAAMDGDAADDDAG